MSVVESCILVRHVLLMIIFAMIEVLCLIAGYNIFKWKS